MLIYLAQVTEHTLVDQVDYEVDAKIPEVKEPVTVLKVVYSVRQSQEIRSQLVLNTATLQKPIEVIEEQQPADKVAATLPEDDDVSSHKSSHRSKISEEESSKSSSSSSEFSNKELNDLNNYCRYLRSRVKGYKRKVEQLETKQMQQIFLGRKFEQKVNAYFDKIKVDTLEQIVKNQVINDILNGHFLQPSTKKSPKR